MIKGTLMGLQDHELRDIEQCQLQGVALTGGLITTAKMDQKLAWKFSQEHDPGRSLALRLGGTHTPQLGFLP